MNKSPHLRPEQVAQLIRMGRGWAVTRNSATLAVTDFEPVGREIVSALNGQRDRAALIAALEFCRKYADMRDTKGDPLPSQLTDTIRATLAQVRS